MDNDDQILGHNCHKCYNELSVFKKLPLEVYIVHKCDNKLKKKFNLLHFHHHFNPRKFRDKEILNQIVKPIIFLVVYQGLN